MNPQEYPVYPKDLTEFEAMFASEEDCRAYVVRQRWPAGYRCPACDHGTGWTNRRHLIECGRCGHQTSLTAGTIFQGSRKPLRVWFQAMWWVCTQKTGLSAAGLQRILGLGSIQTAWTWLHRLRQAMVRIDREPLTGRVQIDDTPLTESARPGNASGLSGARIAVAVEWNERDQEFGRIRLLDITATPQRHLVQFIMENVDRRATLEVDGWPGYAHLQRQGFQIEVIRATDLADAPLPWVRRVAALVRRRLLGTHQGRVSRSHLQRYLDEFVFRYNRRKSPHVGLLFQRLVSQGCAVRGLSYQGLIATSPPDHA